MVISKETTWLDLAKWLLVGLLIAAAVGGNYYYADQSLLWRVIGVVVLLAAALSAALWTSKGQATWLFAKEAYVELQKVIWPTRQETIQTTLIVSVFVIIIALSLWGIDAALYALVKFITGGRT